MSDTPATGVPVRLTKRPLVTESAVGTPPPLSAPGDPITITIDGREVEARAGQLIIDAADEAGVYIPRFCYHPRMKPVGMCRMCLVEVEGPRGSTLMPACYNTVNDGMKIETKSDKATKAQEGVLEFLLVNHPLDCPVCDKGGECPLQDQTLTYGPGESRFVEEKRHWEKPTPISDLVLIDRERCIQCGRCVRFADEVAGDPLIDFFERGDRTEVAVFPDQPYSSYLSGNVVQICPVGALTSKPYRFKARPWDLEQVESTCTTCSVGCRTAIQSTTGEISRLIGVDSDPVNWGWLCDKGRFSYPTASDEGRLSVPLVRRGNELVEVSWGEALAAAAAGIEAALKTGGPGQVGVIGGSRLPNEDAYVWAKLARTVLRTDNVDAQLGDGLPARLVLGLPRATIDQAAAAPLVISIGPDIKEELPILYVRLRHAVREAGLQIVELTPARTGLSPYAAETAVYRPAELAALAAAIAGPASSGSPASAGSAGDVAGVPAATIEAIRAQVARAGSAAGSDGAPSVVVLLGRPSLAETDAQVVAAAQALAGIPGVAFLPVLRRGNVNGALDLGLAPGVLPGRVGLEEGRAWYEHQWSAELPAEAGLDTAGILAAAARGRMGALVLVGADPLADFPDSTAAIKGVLGARFVVAVDTHLTGSARKADVVLPAAAWAERRGTFTNLEGRVTWLSQLVTDHGVAWSDWMIASELAARLGAKLGFVNLEDIWAEIERVSPLHRGLTYETLSGLRARDGAVVPLNPTSGAEGGRSRPRPLDPMADPGIASAELHKIAPTALVTTGPAPVSHNGHAAPEGEAPPRPAFLSASPVGASPVGASPVGASPVGASAGGEPAGSLRLVAVRTLWDGGTQVQAKAVLAGLPPEPAVRLHPSVLAGLGAAQGEKVMLRSSGGTAILPAVADPSLPLGTALVHWNTPGAAVGGLVDATRTVTTVTVSTPADSEVQQPRAIGGGESGQSPAPSATGGSAKPMSRGDD